jgi:uncharacterized protein YbbK (DUF523 family)
MILVSSCLAGILCRYSGGSCEEPAIAKMVRQGKALPVCPELLGGLGIPRPACEIVRGVDGKISVFSKDGRDLTAAFQKGAKRTLSIARAIGAHKAILKSRSPSCGCGLIYDGSFSGKLVNGNGLAAQQLLDIGIKVYTEHDFAREDMLLFQKDE